MEYPLYNKIGQAVGTYNEQTKIYTTIRSKLKGEIFVKKNWFDGKYVSTPIAIDSSILDNLIKRGCHRIDILIMGLKPRSFIVSFSPKWILENSVKINYDSSKMVRWGNQLVFDMEKGIVGGQEQKTLEK